jgi:restriction system protein
MPVPSYDRLFNPTLEALHKLGGSASIEELVDEVARLLALSDTDLAEAIPNGTQSRFEYRLAWARSYLKAFGLLQNSERGVWSLTARGKETRNVDPAEVKRFVRGRRKTSPVQEPSESDEGSPPDQETPSDWREELLSLLFTITPDQFERLCQRVLRESGFTQVEVTGRAGDGGIDGVGTVRLGGLLGFPVLFQCKRFQGSVGPGVVRDFRGAMVGRADRGLILTTGVFTRDARREATRDGAPPIDLVDRDALLDKLKELRLGVDVALVEQITISPEWFRAI